MLDNEIRENETQISENKKREMENRKKRQTGKRILKLHREGYSPSDIALLLSESSKEENDNRLLLKSLIKKHTRHTNIRVRRDILKLNSDGYNQREIARQLGVSPATVNLWINRHGNLESFHKPGRSRKTTSEQDNEIYLMSQNDPFLPATDINRHLTLNICAQTVRNRLIERGLRNFKAPRKTFLLPKHKANRKEFADTYKDWPEKKWENACFADEKTFQSFGNGIIKVWRPKLTRWNEKPDAVTRFDPSVISSHQVSGRFSVSVWGCIGKINRLHRIRGEHFNQNYFLKNILKEYFKSTDNEFLFVQDNAPVHTAKKIQKWFLEKNIKTLKWPAYSPDLNPIENLWGRMEYLTRNRTPTSAENLWDIILEAYEDIISDTLYIQKLVTSMPKRLKEVLRVEGNVIKY